MLNEQQIALINNKSAIIQPCVEFASKFLILPDIDVAFDDCPSKRFLTMDNAAESTLGMDGIGHIWINGVWFADRIEEHQDDVEFFIFHELRHIHQYYQIALLQNGQQTREAVETVTMWMNGFASYTRNEGGDSQSKNITQEVEIDANAYGIILETLYQNGKFPSLSVPQEAIDLADERLQKYVDTLPEFRRFSKKQNESATGQQTNRNVKTPKVGRNDPCPCGSGKKYKRCCGR